MTPLHGRVREWSLHLAVLTVLSLAPGAAVAEVSSAAPSGPSAGIPAPSGRLLVVEIQERLASLGLDPGAADGVAGERTRGAIRAFQRERGEPATGEPTDAVWRSLGDAVREDRAADTLAAGEARPLPLEEAAAEPTLAGTTWKFRDDTGAGFTVTFDPDGGVSGPPFSHDWTWTQSGEEVAMTYENRVGGRSIRSGRLVSDREMTGSGESSRREEWNWQASRLQ